MTTIQRRVVRQYEIIPALQGGARLVRDWWPVPRFLLTMPTGEVYRVSDDSILALMSRRELFLRTAPDGAISLEIPL